MLPTVVYAAIVIDVLLIVRSECTTDRQRNAIQRDIGTSFDVDY